MVCDGPWVTGYKCGRGLGAVFGIFTHDRIPWAENSGENMPHVVTHQYIKNLPVPLAHVEQTREP